MLNHTQLKTILPHAYPFLMIDRVEDYKPGESLMAVKNITANEWLGEGLPGQTNYFPETPTWTNQNKKVQVVSLPLAIKSNTIMGKGLLIEAAAQAALVLDR